MTAKTFNHGASINKCQELTALIAQHTESKGNGVHKTAIDKLDFVRESSTISMLRYSINQPVFGIVVQGKKEALLDRKIYRYGVAQYIVFSVDLPLSGCVVEATSDKPFLALKLNLDPARLYDIIIAQTRLSRCKQDKSVRGLFIGNADISLIDCTVRLTKLLATPQDIPFLAPIIISEIYYRLLMSEQGEAIRQIAIPDSNMQRIAKAIELIKVNFTKPIEVVQLARHASMSTSSFYHHFKKVTSMSPLQYQKQLRLLEARRLMLAENADAASTAYQVGYESPSQFSREYSRMFGAPPIKDIERLRVTTV